MKMKETSQENKNTDTDIVHYCTHWSISTASVISNNQAILNYIKVGWSSPIQTLLSKASHSVEIHMSA